MCLVVCLSVTWLVILNGQFSYQLNGQWFDRGSIESQAIVWVKEMDPHHYKGN